MKKLNFLKIPALFLLLMGVITSAYSQDASKSVSPEFNFIAKDDGEGESQEARKELYRQLGLEWTYDDRASLDAAKESLSKKSSRDLSQDEIETLVIMEREFSENKDEWFRSNPAKYNQYRQSLGMSELPLAPLVDEAGHAIHSSPSTK